MLGKDGKMSNLICEKNLSLRDVMPKQTNNSEKTKPPERHGL